MSLKAGYKGIKNSLAIGMSTFMQKFANALVIKSIGSGLTLSEAGQLSADAQALDYSTTEQNTGAKWIDGKTIYRKSFDLDSDPNGAELVEGVDTIVNFFGEADLTIAATSAQGYNVPFYNSSSYNFSVNKRIAASGSFKANTAYVECTGCASAKITMLYTKISENQNTRKKGGTK